VLPNPSIERTATGLARDTPRVIVPLRGPIRRPPLMSNVRHRELHSSARETLSCRDRVIPELLGSGSAQRQMSRHCGTFRCMAAYRLFLSHGSEDNFIVQHFLKPKLESSGAEVFVDTGRLEYGDDFRTTILQALGQCDELLVLLTPTSVRRAWVTAEIGAALVRTKRVVAVRYGPSEADLHDLGILSLLGNTALLVMEDFDRYIEQLQRRVAGNSGA
jgi:hypothetical protein